MVADQDTVGSGPCCLILIFFYKTRFVLNPDPTPVRKNFSGSGPHKFYLVKFGSGLKRNAPATLCYKTASREF